MIADAFAKVNLGLRVRSRSEDGFHPLVALSQSVDWSDRVEVEASDSDGFAAIGAVPQDHSNLAWRAVDAARGAADSNAKVQVRLEKSIPVASGLGGGSADAACVLAMTAELIGLSPDRLLDLASDLGADVPFCLTGGLAEVRGRGERVRSLPFDSQFALAMVVPPFELASHAVYAAWDELGGPEGPALSSRDLPPGLRTFAPLANDLFPAAVHLQPGLAAWRDELSSRWGRPTVLTGSGPCLFGYFLDLDEAEDALHLLPTGARSARAVEPTEQGWQYSPGTLAAGG